MSAKRSMRNSILNGFCLGIHNSCCYPYATELGYGSLLVITDHRPKFKVTTNKPLYFVHIIWHSAAVEIFVYFTALLPGIWFMQLTFIVIHSSCSQVTNHWHKLVRFFAPAGNQHGFQKHTHYFGVGTVLQSDIVLVHTPKQCPIHRHICCFRYVSGSGERSICNWIGNRTRMQQSCLRTIRKELKPNKVHKSIIQLAKTQGKSQLAVQKTHPEGC